MDTMLTNSNEWQAVPGFDFAQAPRVPELRLEAFCRPFLADVVCASDASQAALKDVGSSATATVLYRHAIAMLLRRGDFKLPVPACSLRANLAWQLLAVAELTHKQIADVLKCKVSEVVRCLNSVNEALSTQRDRVLARPAYRFVALAAEAALPPRTSNR